MRSLKAFTAFALVRSSRSCWPPARRRPARPSARNVDDATITSEVKAKLAAEKMSTLTKIGVDTDRRTVYLTGRSTTPRCAPGRKRSRGA